jgi:hypothetical protein
MTASEVRGCERQAAEILDQLRQALGEPMLVALIDDPIDAAAGDIRPVDAPIDTQARFLELVGGLLKHVCARAFPAGRQLDDTQARGEAIDLLERGFPAGYRAALWEGHHPLGYGPSGVIEELTRLLKIRLRRAYAQWVFTSVVGPIPWSLRCRIAELIFQNWGERRPPELKAALPEQYADYLPLLVQRDLEYHPVRPS